MGIEAWKKSQEAAPSRTRGLLGPAMNLKELNLFCWGLFLVGLVLPLVIVANNQKRAPDADFVYFYAMGRILNDYPSERLYDYELQQKICTGIHPLITGKYGPNPYPPFVGTLFRPFARLPYTVAYALWLSVSLALYLAGLAMVSARYFPGDAPRRSLIFCFALSFYPFVIDAFVNGQLSTIGFFFLALTIREEDLGRPVLSGLALSACLYKPTLLVLILPMLLVTRRFRTLLGFACGAIALTLVATAAEGSRVWSGYLDLVLHYGQSAAGVYTHSFLRLRKYVDLTSFSSSVPGGRSWPGLIVIFGYAAWAAFSLFRAAWKSAGAGRPERSLMWAATLTWTLLLNVYVPRHDSVIVVLSLIVTAAVLRDLPDRSLSRLFTPLWVTILLLSWITDNVAAATGIQIVTVLFAGLGMLQLAALRRTAADASTSTILPAGDTAPGPETSDPKGEKRPETPRRLIILALCIRSVTLAVAACIPQ